MKRDGEKKRAAKPGPRRPYARPDVVSESMLERAALICGQKPADRTGSCRSLPST